LITGRSFVDGENVSAAANGLPPMRQQSSTSLNAVVFRNLSREIKFFVVYDVHVKGVMFLKMNSNFLLKK
jgi:hypothetical protein